jgi:hypothetical protein
MMAVSGSPAWVVRRGEPEVNAGGPQEAQAVHKQG